MRADLGKPVELWQYDLSSNSASAVTLAISEPSQDGVANHEDNQ
jgi:hypothetical protein